MRPNSCSTEEQPPHLYSEIEYMISYIKVGKSPGSYDVAIELTKIDGSIVISYSHRFCTSIWMKKE